MPRKSAPWYRNSKSGTAGRWYVTLGGKQVPLSVTDRNDEQAAWAAFQRLLEKAKAGPVARPEPIAELVNEYLDSISHRITEKTRLDYATHLKRLVARFPNRAAGTIEPCNVEKVAANENWSDSHRANFLWVSQAFLQWAGRKDFRLHRPAKESRGADSLIPPEVHAKVLRETTGDFYQFCRLLWLIGCRPMEGAGLTAESIDWTSATVTLKRHKTKHKGKRRVLYLPAEALTVLREQAEQYKSGYLFRGVNGRPLSRHAIVCRLLRVSAKIGHSVRAYDYRHTFITRTLIAGTPSAVVAALVGTSVMMIDRFYGHVAACSVQLKEAAERAAAAAGSTEATPPKLRAVG